MRRSDPAPSAASAAAAVLLDELIACGVRHVVLSPGSRSQALALAAAALERSGAIGLYVRIDERVAGFTALGIGRESGVPAAVVCTSGTAVTNLAPAVREAHHAGVPLLLLTADRPPELRGVGANQTTAQPGIFGAAVRFDADLPVPDAADGDDELTHVRLTARRAFERATAEFAAGPSHLNLPYREPLAGELPAWFAAAGTEGSGTEGARPGRSGSVGADLEETRAESSGRDHGHAAVGSAAPAASEPAPAEEPMRIEAGPRTVVVAGADAGPDAEELAHAAGFPLIAEVSSGARFGRRLVHGYREALRDPQLGGRIERAIVWGHPTLSREVTALLARGDVDVIALRGPGEPMNLNHATTAVSAVRVSAAEPDRGWLAAWMRHSAEHAVDLGSPAPDADGLVSQDPSRRRHAMDAELAAVRRPLGRELLVDAVWRATWPHDRLVFGSSRLIRVADRIVPGKRIPVHANRGLAGIDGTIATGTGIALAARASGAPGVTRVLLGDLAFLHDVGALHLPEAEDPQPRLQVIVGDDGGGSIFDDLEVAQLASAEDMTRVQYTPHRADIAQLAAAYGWGYTAAATLADLEQALTAQTTDPGIVHVRLLRGDRS